MSSSVDFETFEVSVASMRPGQAAPDEDPAAIHALHRDELASMRPGQAAPDERQSSLQKTVLP